MNSKLFDSVVQLSPDFIHEIKLSARLSNCGENKNDTRSIKLDQLGATNELEMTFEPLGGLFSKV